MLGEPLTGKWGFIDQKGRYAVNPQYLEAQPISEGVAAVLVDDGKIGKWGYIAR